MKPRVAGRAALWADHDDAMRDPLQVAAQWQPETDVDPDLLRFRVRGKWWEALAATRQTLLVTREYEHLVIAMRAHGERRRISVLRLPHPSGLAVDSRRGRVFIASTRNPNIIFELEPASHFVGASPVSALSGLESALLPVRCWYLPGRLYIHDLAFIGGRLHANAVALNAVVELPEGGGFRPVWWPSCIDTLRGPRFDRNYLQLNSIAAGKTLRASFFTASAGAPSRRRPGQVSFPVDGRGVVFSGRTREIIASGLTRPHSARFIGKDLWVANSGHGELGRIRDGKYEPLARLPGWTRGLTHHAGIAFVGSSRVIPRFRHYAPGLELNRSETGVHAVDLVNGKIVGSLIWPRGNQIFAVELTGAVRTIGFPYVVGRGRQTARVREFFFSGAPSGAALGTPSGTLPRAPLRGRP